MDNKYTRASVDPTDPRTRNKRKNTTQLPRLHKCRPSFAAREGVSARKVVVRVRVAGESNAPFITRAHPARHGLSYWSRFLLRVFTWLKPGFFTGETPRRRGEGGGVCGPVPSLRERCYDDDDDDTREDENTTENKINAITFGPLAVIEVCPWKRKTRAVSSAAGADAAADRSAAGRPRPLSAGTARTAAAAGTRERPPPTPPPILHGRHTCLSSKAAAAGDVGVRQVGVAV